MTGTEVVIIVLTGERDGLCSAALAPKVPPV